MVAPKDISSKITKIIQTLFLPLILFLSNVTYANSSFDIEKHIIENHYKGNIKTHSQSKNSGGIQYCEKYVAINHGAPLSLDVTITYYHRENGKLYSQCGFWACENKQNTPEQHEKCRIQCKGQPEDFSCSDFCTTWKCSINKNDLIAAKRFLSQGQDPNSIIDERNRTAPLHTAARHGRQELISLLISSGAYVNILNADAQTPLCVNMNFVSSLLVVKNLIEAGADTEIKCKNRLNNGHETALDKAKAKLKNLQTARKSNATRIEEIQDIINILEEEKNNAQ